MTWKKGQSGNPNGLKPTPWAEALKIVAQEPVDLDGRKRLRLLAEKVFEMAMDGDMQAIQEIGNRLDGKPVQAVVADVTNNVTVDHSWVEQLQPDQLRNLAVIAAKAVAADAAGTSTAH